jgi:predicted nuclease of predicted toxin-antitoxin system
MKLLLDQNISYKAIKKLTNYYPEVTQVGRLGMAQTEDAMIWQYALVNNYIIVTFDAYFQERNLISGNPVKVIWLRLENTATENITRILVNNFALVQQFDEDDNYSCLELLD